MDKSNYFARLIVTCHTAQLKTLPCPLTKHTNSLLQLSVECSWSERVCSHSCKPEIRKLHMFLLENLRSGQRLSMFKAGCRDAGRPVWGIDFIGTTTVIESIISQYLRMKTAL